MAGTVAPPEAFDFTATGILGEKRDTMLENQLLLRVSRSIQFHFTIICMNHLYISALYIYIIEIWTEHVRARTRFVYDVSRSYTDRVVISP